MAECASDWTFGASPDSKTKSTEVTRSTALDTPGESDLTPQPPALFRGGRWGFDGVRRFAARALPVRQIATGGADLAAMTGNQPCFTEKS
jgi:hypothetical protein